MILLDLHDFGDPPRGAAELEPSAFTSSRMRPPNPVCLKTSVLFRLS